MKARTSQAFDMDHDEVSIASEADRSTGQPLRGRPTSSSSLRREGRFSRSALLQFFSRFSRGALVFASASRFARHTFVRRSHPGVRLGFDVPSSVSWPEMPSRRVVVVGARAFVRVCRDGIAGSAASGSRNAAAQKQKALRFLAGPCYFGAQKRTRTSTELPAST